MGLEERLDTIIREYDKYTDVTIGLSFLRQPFIDDFRELMELNSDEDYVRAFSAFMKIAHTMFRWGDYLEARRTVEQSFHRFYEQQNYPDNKYAEALSGFIVSFFNQIIDGSQYEWEDAHPNADYPEPTVDDIDNLFLARLFSVIICKSEDEKFCESIGVRYHFEQLHMCAWFSSQITNGAGQYSRGEANYSARITYNRLLNSESLLWIGYVLGVEKKELMAAAEEMKGKKTNAAKCGVVRKHVLFEVIYALAQKRMDEYAPMILKQING